MMEYSFEKFPKKGYLHVRIKGDNTASTIRRYLGDMLDACAQEKCENVLIEEVLEGPRLRVGEIYQIISEKVGEVRQALRIMAFVDSHPGRDPSNLQFGEMVSVNRGMLVRGFLTMEEAETWLRLATSGDQREG